MGKRLRSFVHVPQDDGSTHIYGPGDEDDITAEDLPKIGDHCYLDDDEAAVDTSKPGIDVTPDADDQAVEKPKPATRRRR